VLASIGRLGVASVREHLAPLHFPDLTTAHRTVAKLFGASYVDVHASNLNVGNMVSLRVRGRHLLAEHGHDIESMHVVPRFGIGTAHLLRANSVRVALVVAARRRDDVRVDKIVSDMDLRRWLGHEARRRDALIPDLLVRLTVGASELRLMVEVDLGSETTRVWSQKVRAIHDRYRTGAPVAGLAPPWRPVLLARESRLRTLARVTADLGGAELWVAGALDAFITDPYGPVLASLGDIAENPGGKITYDLALAPPVASAVASAAAPAPTTASPAKAGAR
jgi:hypothetical protein